MTIQETRDGDVVQLFIDGRVDTTNAPELQQAILNAFQKGSKVILDMKDLAYISSAGLRALLIGQKTAASKGGVQKLVNVGEMIMEIFETTGFSDILNIE
ncbi:MAG: STAS domain-containing protein [Lachnospiraceae bacterium]|nr:STAS domain-containing protein [Lachnospiraceae bacterium]